jgi:hypothetical protein
MQVIINKTRDKIIVIIEPNVFLFNILFSELINNNPQLIIKPHPNPKIEEV